LINNPSLCANAPFQLDGSGLIPECIEMMPGFCGSQLQYINGAWNMYRGADITEVTVGASVNPPNPSGNMFDSVQSALQCSQFIRITESIVNGPLTIPDNTVIYLDSGVTWTTGPLTLLGSFVLTGATNISSSVVRFSGVATTCFLGGGAGTNLYSRQIRFDLTANATNEFLIAPTLSSRFERCTFALSNAATACFSDSVGTPFTGLQIVESEFVGGGAACSEFLVLNESTSQVNCYSVDVTGTFANALAVNSVSPSTTQFWRGITVSTTSNAQFQLSNEITQFIDNARLSTLRVLGSSRVQNVECGTLLLSGDNVVLDSIVVNNFQIDPVLTCQDNSWSNVLVAVSMTSPLPMDANLKVNNFVSLVATFNVVDRTVGRYQWNNVVLGGVVTINITDANSTLQISNFTALRTATLTNINTAPGTAGQIYLSSFSCVNLIYGPTAGNLWLDHLYMTQTSTLPSGQLNLNTTGDLYLNDVFVSGNTGAATTTLAQCRNGQISNCELTGPVVIAALCENLIVSNTTCGNVVTVDCSGSIFNNVRWMSGYTNHCTINGNNNTFTNIRTQLDTGANLTVNGSNNVFSNVHFVASCLFVTAGARFNSFCNMRIQGSTANAVVPTPAIPQTFSILGSQTKLSDVYLGAENLVNVNGFTDDGFGRYNSSLAGQYVVELGDATTTGLQVNNFAFYPRRGQSNSAPATYQVFSATQPVFPPGTPPNYANSAVGDTQIGVSSTAPPTQVFRIGAQFSTFTNLKVWSYPGSCPVVNAQLQQAIFMRHLRTATQLTILPSCSNCSFQNVSIGYGREVLGTYTTPPEWVAGVTYYDTVTAGGNVADIVQFDQLFYECTLTTNVVAPPAATNWVQIPQWVLSNGYNPGDVVMYAGRPWLCLNPTTAGQAQLFVPSIYIATGSPTFTYLNVDWLMLTNYNAALTYRTGQVVTFGGVDYMSLVDNNIGNQPNVSPAFWVVVEPDCGELVNSGNTNVFNAVNTYAITETAPALNNSYVGCRIRNNAKTSVNTFINNDPSTICLSNANFNFNFGSAVPLIDLTTGADTTLTTNV